MKKLLAIMAVMLSVSGCSALNWNCGSASDGLSNNDTVYFDFDSSVLRTDAVETLNKQVPYLKEGNEEIVVSGYADERGTREYNLGLGERRASAVAVYLELMGVDPARLSTVSYGKDNPVDPAHNEEAWAKNRRATTMKVDYE